TDPHLLAARQIGPHPARPRQRGGPGRARGDRGLVEVLLAALATIPRAAGPEALAPVGAPSAMSANVRRIQPEESLRLRALRLRALADAPLAFGSTLAREQAFADEVWRERAKDGATGRDRVTYVAEDGGQWVGMVTGITDDPYE